MGEKEFTHLTETGVHMVEVGAKPQQRRTAVASGKIHLQKEINHSKEELQWQAERFIFKRKQLT